MPTKSIRTGVTGVTGLIYSVQLVQLVQLVQFCRAKGFCTENRGQNWVLTECASIPAASAGQFGQTDISSKVLRAEKKRKSKDHGQLGQLGQLYLILKIWVRMIGMNLLKAFGVTMKKAPKWSKLCLIVEGWQLIVMDLELWSFSFLTFWNVLKFLFFSPRMMSQELQE